jgi:hypothetical protein
VSISKRKEIHQSPRFVTDEEREERRKKGRREKGEGPRVGRWDARGFQGLEA